MLLACRQTIRTFFCVSTIAIAVTAIAGADAKAQTRTQKQAENSSAQTSRPAPVRFFTINEVLTKHGLRDRSYKVAAAGPAAVMNDASRPAPDAAGPEPFGLYGFRAPEGRLWKQWRRLESEIAGEQAALAGCRADGEACSAEAVLFLSLAEEVRIKTGESRIETANRLANRVLRYTSDMSRHGEPDLWSAPLASLAARRGDCEDYAILKYALLREAGLRAEDLRIVLVRDAAGRQDHAVLAVANGSDWLILDNLHAVAKKTADLSHYMPLYALGHDGVTMLAQRYVSLSEPDAADASLTPATAEWGVMDTETARSSGAFETLVL